MIKMGWDLILYHDFSNIRVHRRRSTNVNLGNVAFFDLSFDVCSKILLLETDVLVIVFDQFSAFLDPHHTGEPHFARFAQTVELVDRHHGQIRCILDGAVKNE